MHGAFGWPAAGMQTAILDTGPCVREKLGLMTKVATFDCDRGLVDYNTRASGRLSAHSITSRNAILLIGFSFH